MLSGEQREFAMREAASFIAGQRTVTGEGILSGLLAFAGRILQAWNNRRQIADLAEFDDHMLCDIGLTRQDVRYALELPFSHDPGRELQRLATANRRNGWNA
jgi:uncharacterized protein YjiS (DUF1127 family)